MKIDNHLVPRSSFLSVEKDLNIIVDKILSNKNLLKLLYYTTKDALHRPPLTDEQKLELFGKNIKIVPKLYVDSSVLNYVVINFDNFTPSSNPEFRDTVISFDIICHYDQWHLGDFKLRPYRIAAELDSMLDKKRLTGIGKLLFLGASEITLSDEFAGLTLMYQAVHGEEDKKFMPNPADEEQFISDYKEMYRG